MDYFMEILFGDPAHSDRARDTVMFMSIDDIDKRCPRGINASTASEQTWQSTPFDETCLRRMSDHLRRYSAWEEMLYTFMYFLISFFALVGNGVVILAVIRRRAMRTNRNVLIVNLAISNLMLALTTIPFLWLPSIDFEFPYSKFFCKFANALPGSNIYCSTLTITVMAIDRYYSVKQMQVGQVRPNCLKGVVLSVLIWTLSFLLSFPLLVYYDTTMLYVFKDVMVYDAKRNVTQLRSYGWRQCRLSPGSASSDDEELSSADAKARMIQMAMSLTQVIFLYLVPLIALSIFNMKLTRFLKSNARQMGRARGAAGGAHRESVLLGTGGAQFAAKDQVEMEPSSEMGSAVAPAASPRPADRRRNRTTMLLIAMAGSYAVLWLPFTLVSMLIDLDILYLEHGAAIIERIDQSCKLISILSIGVNPFLYGFLNTNFRHEFIDIFNTLFRCTRKTNQAQGHMYTAIRSDRANRSHSLMQSVHSVCGSLAPSRARRLSAERSVCHPSTEKQHL